MNDTNEPTELSYLEKLRARELKDTPLKEDTENDFQNREEDNSKREVR